MGHDDTERRVEQMETMRILGTVQGLNPARVVPTPVVVVRGRGGGADAPTVPDAAFPAARIEV